jgi:REP element-mobilizing transposase RayT
MGWMARRPRLFAPGILYHVIVRGNYRQKTFLNGRDYEAYLERLVRYRKRFGVTVYCAVPQIRNNFFRLVSQSLWPSLVKYTAAGVRYPRLMCSLS